MAKKAKGTENPNLEQEIAGQTPLPADSSAVASNKKAAKGKVNKVPLDKKTTDNIVTSKRVKREEKRRLTRKVLLGMLAAILLVTSVVYIMLLFIQENSMRIYVGHTNTGYSISLSSTRDFSKPTSRLNAAGPKTMDNVTYSWLKTNTEEEMAAVLAQEGAFNGTQWLANSFFLKNNSDNGAAIEYDVSIIINGIYKRLDECIRIMIVHVDEYQNVEKTIYGKMSKDGTPEMVAYSSDVDANGNPLMCTPFISNERVMETRYSISGNAVHQFVIFLWVEGEDPECTDSVLGGFVKMSMQFDVVTGN